LLVRSLWQLRGVELGFNQERLLLVTLQLDPQQFNAQRGLSFYEQLLDRVRALPGIESASLTKNIPVNRLRSKRPPIAAEGREPARVDDWLTADPDYISPEYFKTLGVSLQQGREFDLHDAINAEPTVIINRTLADKLWPQQDAIGQHLKFLGESKMARVIGIAPDMKYRTLTDPPVPYYYLPAAQNFMHEMTLLIRTAGEPLSLAGTVRETSRAIDRGVFISDVSTINSQMQAALSQPQMAATFAGLLGAIALLLATMGLYSAMSYAVSQRTREIGIRLALGAQVRDVLKLVLGQGMIPVTIGLLIGLAGAFAVTRVLSSLLFGIGTTDPITFIAAAILLVGIALLACWIPAQRATKVDPLVSLRAE